ncbi:MAG TPA: NADH-quinone oxidoreductase subunit NuoK [Frankiaceae bacterium]|nr:NADH-quinone oxidoreductase subunit NuoK [Frankiaceae bacterium]
MHLVYPVALSALLFSIGIYGVLARRNAVLILMSIEIMLNAVNINLIAFDAWLRDPLMGGQMFALFVITVAAAEVGVGLAIVLLIFRNRETIDLDSLRELSDVTPTRTSSRAGEEARAR